MRRFAGVALFVLAASAARAAQPPEDPAGAMAPRPDLPIEGVVTDPHWTRLPDADQFSRYYPPLALYWGLPGSARIGCTVTSVGTLAQCAMITETPAGFGFGHAALQMSSAFAMAPKTIDGEPVSDAKVYIPIRFNTPELATRPQAPLPAGPTPSPRTLVLARRLAAKITDDTQTKFFKSYIQQVRTNLQTPDATAQQKLAIDDLEQAIGATVATRTERHAQQLARLMTTKEMSETVAFLERPAGRRWQSSIAELQISELSGMAELQNVITADARKRLCAQIKCAEPAKK